MANFPIPTSGTAWASGGISGRVGVKQMRRRTTKKSRFAKKPWESTNWIPYMGNFNQNWMDETGAVTDLNLSTASDVKRVVLYAPSLMNQETLAPTSTGRVATEEAIKLRRIQGHVHFDGQMYAAGTFRPSESESQESAWMRVWYSWQREEITTQGYVQNISDLGFGPGVLSDVKQLTSRHMLAYGVIDWCRPKYNPGAGTFTGEDKGGRTYVLPNPRLPPGGLKLGIGEALTCIVRASYGLGYGRDLSADFTNGDTLPMRLQFQPLMRFLVSA